MDTWIVGMLPPEVCLCVCVCQLGVASASTEPCWGFVNSWLTSRLCCSENLSAVKPWDDAWMCAPQQIPSWGLTGSDTTWSLWWGAWRASEGFLVTAFHILCTHSWCTYDLVWLAGRCFVLFIWFEGDYWVWDRMSVSILAVLVNIAITLRLFEDNYIFGSRAMWLGGRARRCTSWVGLKFWGQNPRNTYVEHIYCPTNMAFIRHLVLYTVSVAGGLFCRTFFPLAVHLGSRHTTETSTLLL